MPANQEVIEGAINNLQKIVVESFQADPSVVRWFEYSNITWRVRIPKGTPQPILKLNDRVISEAGSLLVSPGKYTITATMDEVSIVLKELIIGITHELCQDIVVEKADDIRQAIQNELESMFPKDGDFIQRSPATIDFGRGVGRRGLSVQVKLIIPIDNGPIDHVDIDIDLRFSFSIIRPDHDHPKGLAIVYLQGFDVQTDIDLPWYLDSLWFGVFEGFVEGKIDESVEKQLKPKLKACLQRLIDNNLPELPDTLYLSNIFNNNNGDLVLRLCPS